MLARGRDRSLRAACERGLGEALSRSAMNCAELRRLRAPRRDDAEHWWNVVAASSTSHRLYARRPPRGRRRRLARRRVRRRHCAEARVAVLERIEFAARRPARPTALPLSSSTGAYLLGMRERLEAEALGPWSGACDLVREPARLPRRAAPSAQSLTAVGKYLKTAFATTWHCARGGRRVARARLMIASRVALLCTSSAAVCVGALHGGLRLALMPHAQPWPMPIFTQGPARTPPRPGVSFGRAERRRIARRCTRGDEREEGRVSRAAPADTAACDRPNARTRNRPRCPVVPTRRPSRRA